ncbi:MAG: hypothetical protein M0R80_26675 [Proteobacteria bacterium]|jgi:hypothetical protein|nr:hypothetical protein [Pseudomonadota bacterium]
MLVKMPNGDLVAQVNEKCPVDYFVDQLDSRRFHPMRETTEGYIHFPVRGKPPTKDGYEPYNNNPYILQPILVPCTYREQRLITKNNKTTGTFCCKRPMNFCLKKNKVVLRLECKECLES